jgi:alpha-amylase
MQLFDAPMVHNFHEAGNMGKDFDMRNILNNTLVQEFPLLAITIVGNHDAQPLQALEAPVADWFKPLAYALILLREGGIPCLFYPDMYGAQYTDKGSDGGEYEINIPALAEIPIMAKLRQTHNYGQQCDYFDHGNCIGWTRLGDQEHQHSGLAVVMSNGDEGTKRMEVGKQHAGKIFVDALKKRSEKVKIGDDGFAEFHCNAGSASVWVLKKVAG